MEMNSFPGDKVGPGGETATPKKTARKSSTTVNNKEPVFGENPTEPMSLQFFEVVGNLEDQLKTASFAVQPENPNNPAAPLVLGNEVILRLAKPNDPLNMSPEEKFFDIRCRIQTDKDQNAYLPLFINGNDSAPYAYVTNKMIYPEPPRAILDNPIAGVVADSQDNTKYAASLIFQRINPVIPELCPPQTKADDNHKETRNEKSAGGFGSMGEIPAAGKNIDGVVEPSGSDTGTKNGSSVLKEIAERNTENKGQDLDKVPEEGPSKVPVEVMGKGPQETPGNIIRGETNLDGDVQEVVVSSGFAWGRDDQPRTEYYDTSSDIGEGGDVIGKSKMDETSSLTFMKRIKGDKVAENGNAVEIREGKLVEKLGEIDKQAIQDEEIGSVAGELVIEEGNKRKRSRKSEETKKSNSKKRKVEKSRDNDSNGADDGKEKCKSHGDKCFKKDSVKPGSSICDQSTLEETIDRVASGHLSLPFIENLRGEIKNLTRADLEELIVQKLCEVITERSEVGELRKRAEALERNQERWKEKVMSLTKQIKEMDMVMKNYLSEVRRHQAEKSFQMVAPLRVTRSVGLQVSFTSSPTKLAKTPPKRSGDSNQGREKGRKTSNRSILISQPPNKKIPILPSTSCTKPLVIDPNTKFSTKSGLTITLQPVSSTSETQLASKPIPIQPKLSILPATDPPSASLIDLTGDDDRQFERNPTIGTTQQTLTVGPPGQVKVVNHIQPVQAPAGSLTFLISNAGSTPYCNSAITTTTTTESQNRQLAIPSSSIQAPQRHILPAIPTLFYKTPTLIQPGSQASQARSPAIKSAPHPAPLPLPPANQIYKPNWKLLPPRPSLKISKGDTGIVLSWNMPLGPEFETIVSYQLFAYQETDAPPSSTMWKRVGDIKALRLPMACTLTQFLPGHKYYFAVRAVDMHSRVGPFSTPGSITLLQ